MSRDITMQYPARAISIATKTYKTWKLSVMDIKKSQATIAFASFRTNVAQR